jgi:nitrite reductase (NAD(P)H)
MVLNKIEALGVQVLVNCSPSEELTRAAEDGSDDEVFTGFKLRDGSIHKADMVIYAIGIKPRDELARNCGIECHPKGGVVVGNDLQTSATDVYAIGECASWKGNYYGLIAPGSTPRLTCLPHRQLIIAQLKWQIFCLSISRRRSPMLQGQ